MNSFFRNFKDYSAEVSSEPSNITLRLVLEHDFKIVMDMINEQLGQTDDKSYLFSQVDIGLEKLLDFL